MTAPLTLQQLTLDLALDFPGLKVHELPKDTPMFRGEKAWIEDQVNMCDGLPIFLRADENEGREPPGYSSRIHDAFAMYLARRGWQVFRWEVEDDNGQVHLLVPTASVLADLQCDEGTASAGPAPVLNA